MAAGQYLDKRPVIDPLARKTLLCGGTENGKMIFKKHETRWRLGGAGDTGLVRWTSVYAAHPRQRCRRSCMPDRNRVFKTSMAAMAGAGGYAFGDGA